MPRYGNGLNKKIFEAVLKGEVPIQFTRDDVRALIKKRDWNVPEKTISITLSNGAALDHSSNYKIIFSPYLQSPNYIALQNKIILTPIVNSLKPSLLALKFHYEYVFRN